ncbi:MAG: hypothetical protein KJ571_06460 [Bacteroidetes bacterium]|nr:hypothetical protein [Bacteroidota bacterium]
MNKIVLYFGLLVFFISIIIFSQQGLLIHDVLLRSIAVFIVVTIMLSILAIAFLKAINKATMDKEKHFDENNLIGNNPNE